ncbi:family 1 glycosylhydrolase, partial [Klebsiella pneumoniae]|uniref:family 1 glycosylhydrolase n=1 Tax=Klebsiella pneumoniae TaxID=573 RepID=UPI003788DEF9
MQTFATSPSRHHPQGRSLPIFSYDQKEKLKQSYDFLGINYYTSNYAQIYNPSDISDGFLMDCHYKALVKDPEGKYIGQPAFEGSWVYLCPDELVYLLEYIKKTYNVQKNMVITENGAPEKNDSGKTYEQVRDDAYRLKYIKLHIKAIKEARSKGINVMGYFVWSFTDSFEWNS